MRQVTDFEIDPDQNVVIITRVTMTLDEFLRRAGEVYKFATDMRGVPEKLVKLLDSQH